MKLIDDFLNKITMYRLVLYCLIFLVSCSFVFSFFDLLPFKFHSLLVSVSFLLAVCWVSNTIFGKVFKVITNLESVYITALILTLIITPISNFQDFVFLGIAGVLSMASKYIINIKGIHVFNPAALAVTLTALSINSSASWWVGTGIMSPFVLISGLLIIKKVQRFSMVFSFFSVSLTTILGYQLFNGINIFDGIKNIILDTPILFFAFIMLTEPLTSPRTKTLQIAYGGLVGFLFAPFIQIGSIFLTPEVSLFIGNIFSYLVSSKEKLKVKFKEKVKIGTDMFDYIFEGKINSIPGQYMEWTLGHNSPDSRGTRRYFTLASSPTENNLRIGIKHYQNPSSWKNSLSLLNPGDNLMVGYLSGEFNLPKDQTKKLVFIAGGIGITPFRSIVKYLIDNQEKRDIVILYSVKNQSEIVYKDIFDSAQNLGIKTIYVTTDTMGYIDKDFLIKKVPDFKKRYFYLSGPHSMVDTIEKTLKEMEVSSSQIKTDFFPGYA